MLNKNDTIIKKIPEFPCLFGRQGFAASGMTFAGVTVIPANAGIYNLNGCIKLNFYTKEMLILI